MKQPTKIVFTSKERRMLKSMAKKSSEETVAAALKVSKTTIRRWIAGENVPPYSARIMIAQLYGKSKQGGK